MYYGILNHKLRQSYGVLYNSDVIIESKDYFKEPLDIKEFLSIDEEPEKVTSSSIDDLISDFKDYKKISRFNRYREYVNIEDW